MGESNKEKSILQLLLCTYSHEEFKQLKEIENGHFWDSSFNFDAEDGLMQKIVNSKLMSGIIKLNGLKISNL